MLKKILLLFCISSTVLAQKSVDIAFASREGFSPAISFQHLYGLGQSKKLKIGWGIRSTAYFSGSEKEFITAPAKLTSGKQSIVAFFTEYKPEKLDTMRVAKTGVVSVNAMIALAYDFGKLGLGFNIDALGLTFGKKQNGVFQASESATFNNKTYSLKPTSPNLLLISDSDIGSLNSELFAKYQASEKIGLRLGLSFQFIEYKADQKLTFDNDRFRYKTLMPLLALNYRL